jgi:hypothetical protein
MTAVARIHQAEDQVATMQSYLADAQEILGVAEEVAMAGRRVRRCSRRLMVVPIALLGVVAVLIVWRKLRARQPESGSVAGTPESP